MNFPTKLEISYIKCITTNIKNLKTVLVSSQLVAWGLDEGTLLVPAGLLALPAVVVVPLGPGAGLA